MTTNKGAQTSTGQIVELSKERNGYMKKLFVTMALLVGLVLPAFGQLTTGNSVGSAGQSSAEERGYAAPLGMRKLSTGGANVTALVVRMPSRFSPGWSISASNLIADAIADKINMVPHELTFIGDYSVCNGKFSWYNTMYSRDLPLWKDELNPVGTFAGQFGETPHILLRANSKDGGNSIPLSRSFVSAASSDTSHLLTDTYYFNNTSYTDLAPGFTAEGNKIASGSSDTPVAKYFALAEMKLFNGAGSADGIRQIKDYVLGNGNFTINYLVGITGDTSSQFTTSVSLNGPGVITAPKIVLTPAAGGGSATLMLENGTIGSSYQLQFSSDLRTWGQVGVIGNSGTVTVPFTSTNGFWRVIYP